MKITLLEINDYKRLKSVIIEPGERNLILVGGKNTHGKSSLLGAMGAALGGKKEVPEEPIRHGADKASIRIEFDEGALVVRRKFTKKSTTIEVTSDGKVLKSPQKILDELVGARFIDPMRFSRLPAKEQREVMLDCVELDIDLDDNFAKEKEAYEERRALNRDIKKLEAKAGTRPPKLPKDAIDPAGQQKALDVLLEDSAKATEAKHRAEGIRRNISEAEEKVRQIQAELKMVRQKLQDAKSEADKLKEDQALKLADLDMVASQAPSDEEIAQVRERLSEAMAQGEEVAAIRAQIKQHEEVSKELADLKEESRAASQTIEALKDLRKEALAKAEMPIPGLTFDEDGLQLNGSPFDQASGAEKLRASIAIAWSLKPELQDIWVEDGALLDEDSLALVREFAELNDLRVWLERVGESDEGAIIMREGEAQDA